MQHGLPHQMRGDNDPCCLLTAFGCHDDPVANMHVVLSRAEVIHAPRVAKADPNDALDRRIIVIADHPIIRPATALPYLLTRFEPALETLSGTGAGLINRRWRQPRVTQAC
ncbi:MAG: hypothetical protein M3Q50_09640 [Chloroflexota bacterium]|nr:hypothetical protein [Chloroflexota bacterium]